MCVCVCVCLFQVSRPYLGFGPDPKHFIVNCEQNVVKFAGKWGKMYWKMQALYKIFWQNKMLYWPTIPRFFRAETWNTHIFFLFLPKQDWKPTTWEQRARQDSTWNGHKATQQIKITAGLRTVCSINYRGFKALLLSTNIHPGSQCNS